MLTRTRVPFGYGEIRASIYSIFNDYNYKFLNEFKYFLKCSDVKLVNRARSALYLVLKSMDLEPGDGVICPAFTCLVIPETIIKAGAKPVLVDIDPDTFNINLDSIEERIDNKIKAIIPIHLFGNPAEIGPIMEIAKEKDIYVIEDCAQAMGAEYNGKLTGRYGDFSLFSLGHGKNITAGEGGILAINNKSLNKRISTLYNLLSPPKSSRAIFNLISEIGYFILSDPALYSLIQQYINSRSPKREAILLRSIMAQNYCGINNSINLDYTRMSNIIAGMGLSQLEQIDDFNARRIKNANYLNRSLRREGLSLPYVSKNCKHIYLRYVIKIDEKESGISRDELINKLRSFGIDAEVPYMHIKDHNLYYRKFYENKYFPNTESISDSIISLPIHPCLRESHLAKITESLN